MVVESTATSAQDATVTILATDPFDDLDEGDDAARVSLRPGAHLRLAPPAWAPCTRTATAPTR